MHHVDQWLLINGSWFKVKTGKHAAQLVRDFGRKINAFSPYVHLKKKGPLSDLSFS